MYYVSYLTLSTVSIIKYFVCERMIWNIKRLWKSLRVLHLTTIYSHTLTINLDWRTITFSIIVFCYQIKYLWYQLKFYNSTELIANNLSSYMYFVTSMTLKWTSIPSKSRKRDLFYEKIKTFELDSTCYPWVYICY